MDGDRQVAISIESKFRHIYPLPSEHCSIFQVPKVLRRHNVSAYEPVLVSIGPYHRGKEGLQSMEGHKLRYLHRLLNQEGRTSSNTPQTAINLEIMVAAVRELEDRAFQSYEGPLTINREKFIEVMVIDGCFIIELLLKNAREVMPEYNDPIFSMPWILDNLRHDLILLENQIPWFVLETLCNQIKPHDEEDLCSLVNHSLSFLHHTLPTILKPPPLTKHTFQTEPKHLLDLLYCTIVYSNVVDGSKFIISKATKEQSAAVSTGSANSTGKDDPWEPVPCVTDLSEAGVRFRRGSQNNILNVEFRNGVLILPPLIIYEPTECLLRNLVALEQSHHDYEDKMASYILLIDALISTHTDVHRLCEKGIIDNWLGSEKDVSNLVNNLRRDVSVYNFLHAGLCRQVKEYVNTPKHQWKATFMRDYCNTPWKILSLVAASTLLILTLLQTIFSILSYSNPQ